MVHVLSDDVICFLAAKNSHSSLQWDCILFFVECNQSEKQGQGKRQTSKTTKEATKENKHKVVDWHENEAQSP